MNNRSEEHSFSIEIKSQQYVKKMSFLDEQNGSVFFEGSLGSLKSIALVEGLMLELEGTHGVLRVDVTQNELQTCLTSKGGKTQ